MLQPKTHNKSLFIIICILFCSVLNYNIIASYAGDVSDVPTEDLVIEGSENEQVLTGDEKLEYDADNLFYSGLDNKEASVKEEYLKKALEKYLILLSKKPNDVGLCTQIAVIYDNLGQYNQSKEYFFRAINIEPLDPFVNFYYAEYYFAKKDYLNALNHYLVAYNNGYNQFYQVSLKLATVYEKLGDIQKSINFYALAGKLNPELPAIPEKIQNLDNVYYSRTDYN